MRTHTATQLPQEYHEQEKREIAWALEEAEAARELLENAGKRYHAIRRTVEWGDLIRLLEEQIGHLQCMKD
jgi:transcription elongation GreA/GreB family factor